MAKQTRQTEAEKAQAWEAAGIPASKPFTVPEEERVESGRDRILACHIEGALVRDLNLPENVLAALDYWCTDEGVEEKNSRPMVREASGVTVGAGDFEKSLMQKKDDVRERGMDLFEARDPLKEVSEKYARAGFKHKYLSPKRVQENAGTGIYQVVKSENGDPVKVHGMVLGEAPIEKVKARNDFYQRRGTELLKQISDTYKREGGQTAVADQ